MHVLFLEIETESTWTVASIGPAFLAAYLRDNGHSASIHHVKLDDSVEDVVAAICSHAPGLVGLSLTTRQWLRARDIMAAVRDTLHVPVITGGLHPTFAAEQVLRAPGFDYVCLGEGEGALLDVANHIAAGQPIVAGTIDNIQVAGAPKPKLRPPLDPLDSLPFMARDMLNEQHGIRYMITQRGCPFPCTYCAARMYNEMYDDYGRRRSHDNVLDEIKALQADGATYLMFLDDTFTINHKWVREFCRRHSRESHLSFALHARAETINQRMLGELAEAGCSHITFGVESGSERVRREIMQRHVSNKRLIEAFRWSREAGIITTANYMLGLPGETRDDLDQTLALHHELQPHDFGYFVFYPYPGTPLYKTCIEMGILPDGYQDMPANHRSTILKLEHLTQADIDEYYDRFTALREQSYLDRYGSMLDASGKESLREQYKQSAATG